MKQFGHSLMGKLWTDRLGERALVKIGVMISQDGLANYGQVFAHSVQNIHAKVVWV